MAKTGAVIWKDRGGFMVKKRPLHRGEGLIRIEIKDKRVSSLRRNLVIGAKVISPSRRREGLIWIEMNEGGRGILVL